ncbi:MAG: hypothetical protein OHK0013_12000 [Sandaracinaceae bacterium]
MSARRWERWTRGYARASRAEVLEEALAELAGADAEQLGTVVGWLLDGGDVRRAEPLIARLRELDAWRASVEGLWVAYRRSEGARALADAGTIVALVDESATREPGDRARMALALGKICSDSGGLDASRRWLIEAASHARRAVDDDALAAAFGALGEVLFLGGRVLEALDAIALDESLLPPGSAERDRLLVYRGHCYRELGDLDVARALYEQARAAARLRGAEDSPWALRGLAWCELCEPGPGRGASAADSDGDGHPLGLTLLGRAWALAREGNVPGAEASRRRAAEVLARGGYPQEAAVALGAVADLPLPSLAAPREVRADACDEHLLAPPLVPRRESLERAARALETGEDVRGLTGAFF